MLPEIKRIEAQLKQILYGCVEHVQATKAALYLSATGNLNDKTYELITSYQYNAADRKVVTANDDLVDRLTVKRNAFFVNGLGSDQRFAEMLFRQGNDRLLAAPLFSRGRLVGFIDMRDKAGRKPFENPDVDAARRIADQMIDLLASNNLFGLAPITLVDDPTARPMMTTPAPITLSRAASPATPVVAVSDAVFSTDAMKAIERARQFLSKRQHTQQNANRKMLGETELDIVRLLLPASLAIPNAIIGCFTAIGHINNPQFVVARSTIADEAMEKLQAHLDGWLKRTNQLRLMLRPQIAYPFGVLPAPIATTGPIVSAPVTVAGVEGLVLTFAFDRAPDAAAQRSLKVFLRQIEQAVESALTGTSRNDRQTIAEMIVEPDFQKYPELAEHCREVATIAHRFAKLLELPPAQVETVRLAAFVHDVGLRLLDYQRLYRKINLTAEEMRGLAEHPVVGAALVEPLLGSDVAQAVLRHHERVDGKGYPSRLTGAQIPLTAKILQITDAWVAMTSTQTYQAPISRKQALQRLQEGAGTQFDAALVERFLGGIDELAP
ncbi:MAG TPA: HD domain-containing phosphohydrolase [Thermoanaerobaculia bacterium]|nr:HD domain-containing phosphohydrolase [Thermoanaerobaculia bacterium]